MREITFRNEKLLFSERACFSENSAGRVRAEEPCPLRTDFQRDRDRIIHSNSFRRLKHKTQVFLMPRSEHYRTRLTHTLEVAQIARTIARALRLNEDLTEAIALGHDLGHTPFGHDGERALNAVYSAACGESFRHNVQSLRVVDVIDKEGEGLNLTAEVRDGILNHGSNGCPRTSEGQVVQFSDKIA
jgi:dGTPase